MLIPILVVLTILFASSSTYAAQPSVVLNEFSSSTNPEWVELYNPTDSPINLNGYVLLFDSNGSTTQKIVFSQSDTIPAKGLKVAEHSYTSSTQAWLNNSGDTIILKVGSTTVDLVAYGSEPDAGVGAPSLNQSAARLPDGDDWFGGQIPTKGTANSISEPPPPPPPSGNIILSEFMPDPNKNEREWVELFNPNPSAVDLNNWQLKDATNTSKKLSGTIAAKSYKVFEFSSGWLNNSGDTLSLINPGGESVESYSYKETIKGDSFAKDAQGTWQITTTPTPSGPNKITQPAAGQTSSVKSSAAKSTTNSQTNATAADTSSSGLENDGYNLNSNSQEVGTVAGTTNQKQKNSGLAILLTAAGFSFIFAAGVWPAVEKRLWRKAK